MAPVATFAGPTAFFDFEDQPLAEGLTSLELVSDVVTATLTRGGETFDIADLSAGSGTVQLGQRTLVPSGPDDANAPFRMVFSKPLTSFSVQLGDFGDDDDLLSLRAFNASGREVAGDFQELPAIDDSFTFATLFAEASRIVAVEFVGGVDGNFSVAADNVGVAVIPLPAPVLAALPAALLAGGAWRRMRRSIAPAV